MASSGFPTAGSFASDNPLLDRIKVMSNWTQLNNAHHKPTDTPSREKNGWTGDAWADAEAWILDFDVSRYYVKWIRDIADSLISTGELPEIAPAAKGGYGYDQTPGWSNIFGPTPAWDAAFWEIPWDLYRYHGNADVIREVYPAQRAAMAYYATLYTPANGYHDNGAGLGEYSPGTLGSGNHAVISRRLYYRFLDIMAAEATLLGRTAEAAAYRTLANDVLRTFIALYWDETTHSFQKPPLGNLEAEQVMALAYDMVPGSDLDPADPRHLAGTQTQAANRASTAAVLAGSIAGNGNRIGVGIYGLHYLFGVLDEYGYTDLATASRPAR